MRNLDPQATLTALLMASASPILGKYALIMLAAIFGALVALSRTPQSSRWEGIKQIFRSVCFATALTSLGATVLARYLNVPAYELLSPVAFIIAVIGDQWFSIKDKLVALATRGKDA